VWSVRRRQETIRTALAMGADRGVLLQTDAIPADGFVTAKPSPPSCKAVPGT